jgi:hypothetical protein
MATITEERTDSSTSQKLRVVLASGDEITCSLQGDRETARRELDAAIVSLGSERFLRVGDDTIVRSDDVRLIQLRSEHEQHEGGFLQDLKTKFTGGDGMTTTDQGNTQTVYRSGESHGQQGNQGNQGSGWSNQPWIGYGRRPWSETKPFFMTSEFLTLILGVAGVLIAVWQAENFESPRAWMYVSIIAAAYIVSRGIAKAGTRDPNPDRNRGGGYGG